MYTKFGMVSDPGRFYPDSTLRENPDPDLAYEKKKEPNLTLEKRLDPTYFIHLMK